MADWLAAGMTDYVASTTRFAAEGTRSARFVLPGAMDRQSRRLRPKATFFPAPSGDLGRFHGYGSPGVTAPPLTSPSRLREALDRLKTFKKRQEQKQ